jgi:prepilin-type N-terminal cleavage/methylation domain-containing protein
MSDRRPKPASGFSLLEMTVAMALGTIVLGAAVQLYSKAVSATWTASQQAEMQQDFRAASNMLTSDLSMAGGGLGNGAAIQLPTSSTIPVYGCDQTPKCYINGGSLNYPLQTATPYMYGLIPGYNVGPTLLTAQGPTDVTTVVYTDPNFFLDCYQATVSSATAVTFTLTAASQASSNCTANGATIQAVNDSAVGLTAGDLVLFTFGTTQIVAEVTAASSTGATFASGDVLKMNQPATSAQSLASKNGTTGVASRVFVITYYIDNTVNPPRLMRQVSGHTPMPVAENVVYLKFTYDLYNASTNTTVVQQCNPGANDTCDTASAGLLPNQITKINIQNMAMDSSLLGSQFGLGNSYQRIDLQTSVGARNLTYLNNYNTN